MLAILKWIGVALKWIGVAVFIVSLILFAIFVFSVLLIVQHGGA
jgi:hypothetical protein